jgi:hypothetical protein
MMKTNRLSGKPEPVAYVTLGIPITRREADLTTQRVDEGPVLNRPRNRDTGKTRVAGG